MEVFDGITDVGLFNLRQSLHHSIYRVIRIMFRIANTVGEEHAYQAGADHLIAFTGRFAVRVQPLKQGVKWFGIVI
jgi:hypothetical protein